MILHAWGLSKQSTTLCRSLTIMVRGIGQSGSEACIGSLGFVASLRQREPSQMDSFYVVENFNSIMDFLTVSGQEEKNETE